MALPTRARRGARNTYYPAPLPSDTPPVLVRIATRHYEPDLNLKTWRAAPGNVGSGSSASTESQGSAGGAGGSTVEEAFWTSGVNSPIGTGLSNVTAGQYPDGSRVAFTLLDIPIGGTLEVRLNGQSLINDPVWEYTDDGAGVITFGTAPADSDVISGRYWRT